MVEVENTPPAQILIVDDEIEHGDVMGEALRRMGHVCTIVHDLASAEEELRHGNFDLVVTDLVMESETDGMKVLEITRETQANAETVMVTAHGDVPTAMAAVKQGAYDFIEKPLDLELYRSRCDKAIKSVLQRAQISDLREQLDDQYGFEGIIGTSQAMRLVVQKLRQYAPTNIPVLISGASGTGKELVAKALHNNSKCGKQRFVPLNCAGLSESILEDELFGHVRGAFTGADREREGRFEYAHGGSLFLDEVGDMPLIMQAKLLRVLESGEVVRLGANEQRNVDVRLIAATNRDLNEMVQAREFREDLYFRIKGAEIRIAPLCERLEDIPLLARHFAQFYAKEMDKPVPAIAEDTQRALMRHDWPGNVRQLINVIHGMIVIAEGDRLELAHLPQEIREGSGADTTVMPLDATTGMSLEQLEKNAIRNALRLHIGNREQAAKSLGIGERTLYRKLKEYGLK